LDDLKLFDHYRKICQFRLEKQNMSVQHLLGSLFLDLILSSLGDKDYLHLH